jgi:hypothetical protein
MAIVVTVIGTLILVTHLKPEKIASDADPAAIEKLTSWRSLPDDRADPSRYPPFAEAVSTAAAESR